MYDPEKRYPVTPCMNFYKSKIQSDGSLDKVKLIIVVRGDLKSKKMIGYTWAPTASMRTLKYLFVYYAKYKSIIHLLYLTGAFLQANVKHRVFVKLDSIYGEYFP